MNKEHPIINWYFDLLNKFDDQQEDIEDTEFLRAVFIEMAESKDWDAFKTAFFSLKAWWDAIPEKEYVEMLEEYQKINGQ